MSLAASYNQLFRKIEKEEREPKEVKQNSSSPDEAWEEDSWTEQDMSEAQQLIDSNRGQCLASSVPKQHCSSNRIAWDQFYRHHSTNFFKDRNYLMDAFPAEFGDTAVVPESPCLLELGCGVGNAILPFLDKINKQNLWRVLGVDISAVAIGLLKQDPRFVSAHNNGLAFCAVGDLSSPEHLPFPDCVASVVSMIYVLSAVDNIHMAADHAFRALRPGGVLLFRDYGRYDEAQIKLATQRNKLLKERDNFYRKQDGTKCYYFTLEDLEAIFVKQLQMMPLELNYIRRVYKNRQSGQSRRRVWVQARFQKKYF